MRAPCAAVAIGLADVAMSKAMRWIVCMLVALSLGLSGWAAAAAPSMVSADQAVIIVKAGDMNCSACGKMQAARVSCDGSQCAVTGIVPAAVTGEAPGLTAFDFESAPLPRGLSHKPPIFPA